MKNASLCPSIKFRNKFASKIPENLEETVVKAVEHINSLSDKAALDLLWQLNYNPEVALNRIGMTLNESVAADDGLPFVSPKLISQDLVIPLRNELRYQRKCVDQKFCEITVSDGMTDAFNTFYDATSQDDIISAIVLNACQAIVKYSVESDITRCIILLSSDQENNFFGGLRSLRFNREEAEFLKPYAKEISRLLSALYNEEQEIAKSNFPFNCLADRLDQVPYDEEAADMSEAHFEESLKAEEPEETIPADKPVTEAETTVSGETLPNESKPESNLTFLDIVANPELFSNFLEAYDKLQDAYSQLKAVHINPDEVISKRESISKLLEAIKSLG